jgi:peroxiredoxin
VQRVELQGAWQNLQPAGLAIFALSYDSVETLAHFAQTRGITYPLLSDQGSRTISALGLLIDTHLVEQHAFYGIKIREDQHGVACPQWIGFDS